MSEEFRNENEESARESIEEAPREKISSLFESVEEKETPLPKKARKISLHSAIFACIALVLAAVMLTYTCLTGIYQQRLAQLQVTSRTEIEDQYYPFELFDQIFSQLGFSELDQEAMIAEALKGYVAATGDRYAAYYTAEEYAAMLSSSEGKTQGIGINIAYNTIEYNGQTCEVIQIIHVTKASPAYEAGLRAGDVIYSVGLNGADGTVDSLGYGIAVSMLQGVAETTVSFEVLRRENGVWGQPTSMTVMRKEFVSDSVYGMKSSIDPTVGIVRIVEFDLQTPKQFCEAMDALIAQGCQSFAFDLRDNFGGSLQSIEAILSYFLSEGDVLIRIVDKAGNEDVSKVGVTSYSGMYEGCSVSAEDIGKYKNLPSVVLCNGATASAAELFTATFRDYGIGKIVGTQTYGKGTMQTTLPLVRYGVSGALKLTTAKYYSAKDSEGYDGVGITPDHKVELVGEDSFYIREEAEDQQLSFALGLLK